MQTYRNLFFCQRIYWALITIVSLFTVGYIFPAVFVLAKISVLILATLTLADVVFMFAPANSVIASRKIPERLSLSDENNMEVQIRSHYPFKINVVTIDELPAQFQIRNFRVSTVLHSGDSKNLSYSLTPKQRGSFVFGKVHVFVSSPLNLVCRRFSFGQTTEVPVYPSFMQMRKYELLALTNRIDPNGVKKVRRPGKHTEFDQVRDYTQGDDFRLINWKATAKLARPMVNQYQEELAKDVYCVIDMGRVMKQPFEQLTLLDYSINASLALSNIALQKHDKVGLITFTTSINTFINADRRNNQLNSIMEALYNQETKFPESNYDLLYLTLKKQIRQRSLLVLFSNFESMVSLRRHITPLQNIARNHLVLLVMFENTEIPPLTTATVKNLEEAYVSTIAEKFIFEKKQMVAELNRFGIKALITQPANLTTSLINKYLDFKNRELI